ncbi:ATPase, histidine kinase-, DNA gyrase B-, and HSP90-like domain protein [Verrucomicrobiia bacterium DG1235]|nr:ATPase, histidine kinase-, DNA gyrase B-, and HSP90-like domain protein [Verrucomicrobiae bacterium DG1235]
MTVAPIPENEPDRLEALKRYQILDTENEELFDSIAKLAAIICEVPIALISLIDEERQWFKAKVGLDAKETSRELAFCAHAILEPEEMLLVPDATKDKRFRDNPLVTGAPDIRFYAGSPIVTHDRQALGTLCVIDTETRELSEKQKEALRHLSKQVCANLELRLAHDRLEKLNESKNRFFSILSHDLRSPLSSVLSIAEMLLDPESGLSPEDEQKFKGYLLANAKVTRKTAENLLQMVQFEQGRFKFEPQEMKLLETLESAKAALSGRSTAKRIEVNISCNPDLTAWADPSMLQSITQNLLSNALKFSHPDSEIRISAQPIGETLSLTVEDFGIGIKPHALPTLFDLESSYSTAGTSGELGSGLGLTLCKQFATRLGGSLQIESEYGKGTLARLTLPSKKEP